MAVDSLGLRFVLSTILHKDISTPNKAGIDESHLLEGAKEAYVWVKEYLGTHGDFPTSLQVEENCGVALPDSAEDVPYLTDLVRKRALSFALKKKCGNVIELLDSREPDRAVKEWADAELFRGLTEASSVTAYTDDITGRIDYYEEAKSGAFEGVPTPWESLNKAILGWVNGSMNVLGAKTNTGKSWFSVIVSEFTMSLGKKVLLVSMEMPHQRMARRIDALHYKIPFYKLRNSRMNKDDIERWRSAALAKPKGDILIADKKQVKTVDDVMALVMEFKPDLVVVDGGYRFETRKQGKSNWDSTVNIINQIQWSAEVSDIPWVITTQMGDSNETGKEKKRGPKMLAWNVRYGKEWLINPDVFIGLFQNDDLRLIHQSQIHILKDRDTAEDRRAYFNIHWRLVEMDFTEVDMEEEEAGVTAEKVPEVDY